MSSKKLRLYKDERHCDLTHLRWMDRRNRKQEEDGYKDKWQAEQCGGCQFFIPLTGALIEDYGACSNPASPFDGTVMFEHDGCDFFSEAEDGWGA